VLRGIDLAIVSGVAAARAIISAQKGAEVGPNYVSQLEKLNLTPTLKLFAGWPDITSIPRMADAYPQLANDALKFMFTVDGNVPDKMPKAMMGIIKRHVSIGQLIADGWKGVTSI
ncbi:MAG: FAD-dependent oxidoreductase, partial [Sporomusaceae bacterium]|nr:FAD-dependent oxidoreductase [Sporomusaceae bacterium]